MQQQWTTVTDSVKKASHDAGSVVSLSHDDSRKNRRIALAIASTGMFLILVGATPFVFNGGSDSSDFAAFLGQDPEFVGVNATPPEGETVGIGAEDLGDDMLDLGAEPVQVDLPAAPSTPGGPGGGGTAAMPQPPDTSGMSPPVFTSPSPSPAMTTPPATSPPSTPTPYPTLAPTQTPVQTPVQTPTPTFAAAPTPEQEDEVMTETVDFPINTHVDGSAEPVDFRVVVGEDFHMSAPEQPESGAPLLPLLAFSGAGAAWIRARQKKRSRR